MLIRVLHVIFGQTEGVITMGLGWARREILLAFLAYRTLEEGQDTKQTLINELLVKGDICCSKQA